MTEMYMNIPPSEQNYLLSNLSPKLEVIPDHISLSSTTSK